MSAPITKRNFLWLLLALGGCTEYALVATADKGATVLVPDNSRVAFDAALKLFAEDKKFKIVIVPGSSKGQVAYELSDSNIVLDFDNPFGTPEEYSVGLYQKEKGSLSQAQIDELWNELKAKVIAIVGVERWLEKEVKKVD